MCEDRIHLTENQLKNLASRMGCLILPYPHKELNEYGYRNLKSKDSGLSSGATLCPCLELEHRGKNCKILYIL